MVNTNKADGFGLCGSDLLYLSCCSVPSSCGTPGYEKKRGRMEVVRLQAPSWRLVPSVR